MAKLKILTETLPLIVAECRFAEMHPTGVNARHMTKWCLQYVTDGKGIIGHGPERFAVYPGDALLVPPGVLQNYPNEPGTEQFRYLWMSIMPKVHLNPLLKWPVKGGGIMTVHIGSSVIRKKIVDAFEELMDAFHVVSPPRRMELCFNIIEKILLWLDAANPETNPEAGDPRIMKAAVYMMQHYPEKISVAKLAAQCSLSPVRFAHLFREITGTSPMKRLRQIRLDRALDLLITTDHTLAQIAESCGFCNAFHFSQLFKDYSGQSPSAYRKSMNRGEQA